MLSDRDNELLTRIGPGTPMGKLLRQYWIPIAFPDELSSDGEPQRVRLVELWGYPHNLTYANSGIMPTERV